MIQESCNIDHKPSAATRRDTMVWVGSCDPQLASETHDICCTPHLIGENQREINGGWEPLKVCRLMLRATVRRILIWITMESCDFGVELMCPMTRRFGRRS